MSAAFLSGADLPVVAILAGGLATRLREVTGDRIPKSLVLVAGRPFLAHQLDLLRAQGVRRVVLCVGHHGAQIEAAFGDGHAHGVELIYSDDGPKLAGTAGALRRALPKLGREFFTLYGDSYLEIDHAEVLTAFRAQPRPALMTVIARDKATEPANVWFEKGLVRAYGKKQPVAEMRHVDYGLGLFSASVFDGDEADLGALQARLAREDQIAGFEVARRYFEIGSPRGLAELESHLKARAT